MTEKVVIPGAKARRYEAKDILKTVKVAGKNGQKILEGDWKTSPMDRMIMNLEQARQCVKKGFFIWVYSNKPNGKTVYLNIRTMDQEIEKLVVEYNLDYGY